LINNNSQIISRFIISSYGKKNVKETI